MTCEIPDYIQEIIEDSRHNGYPIIERLYLEAKKDKKILEMGINTGRSTRAILYGCRDGNQGHLWSIDWGLIWDGSEPNLCTFNTIKTIERLGLSKYHTWVKKNFYEIPDEWFKNNRMDVILVDFDANGNYQEIIRKCLLSMRAESKLMVHNLNVFKSVKEAVLEVVKTGKYNLYEVPERYGLGIVTNK